MARTFTFFLSLVLVAVLIVTPAHAAKKDGFAPGATADELREEYERGTIRILIAPGHEPGYGGAIYQGVYEREIVTEIADELNRLLEGNNRIEVVTTRSNEAWHGTIGRYFERKARDIEKFVKVQKKVMAKMVRRGEVDEPEEGEHVDHATAPTDVALRLYGINRWANENDIDFVLNLHVNDATDHGPNEPSKHTGYTVYIPDSAYGNSRTSKELARAIDDRLAALSNVSTYPGEDAGVVEDQTLIAIGANGTLNVPSVLIEYGYITEPRFTLPEHRETVTQDTAYQTYLAIQDFFNDEIANPRSVAKLPTTWPESVATSTPAVVVPSVATTTPVTAASPVASSTALCMPFEAALLPATEERSATSTAAVTRLQTILAKDSAIYPEGLITGYFGPATLRAVQAFQKKLGIASVGTPETTGYGAVGPRTAAALIAACRAS